MENKMKFKKGQRAWSSKHGWGVVMDIASKGYIQFIPDKEARISLYQLDGRWCSTDFMPTLFHREQKYDFREPEIAKDTLGFFWDDAWQHRAIIGYHAGLSNQGHRVKGGTHYDNFCAHPELPPHLKENQ